MKTSFLSEGGLWLLSDSIRLQEATIIHMIPQGTMRLRCKVSRSTQTGGEPPKEERWGVTQVHTHLCGSPCAKRSHHRLGAAQTAWVSLSSRFPWEPVRPRNYRLQGAGDCWRAEWRRTPPPSTPISEEPRDTHVWSTPHVAQPKENLVH